MINIGSVLFVGSISFPIRYGILVDYDKVVWMKVNRDIELANGVVILSTVSKFCDECPCFYDSDPKYDISLSRERALRSIGIVSTAYYSITGDDFVYWCISGHHYHEALNNCFYFGKHISTTFKDLGMFKARHHGIGIENNLVIHFFAESPNRNKALFSRKHVQITSINYFGDSIQVEPQKLSPLVARNRAINCYLLNPFGDYNLLTNNCEHLANWCSNGKHDSLQIRNDIFDISISALAAFVKPQLLCRTTIGIAKRHLAKLL